jgi:Flp pilus assembly protein TadD
VALLAIVALVGVVVYTQWTGDSSRPAAQRQNGAPAQAVDPSALLRLQQSVEADPNDADALLHLSNALQDNAQLERAVETYGRYLAIRPKDADARVDMGICLYQLGLADSALAPSLFARAVREMRTALAGNPAHQPAAFNLAIVFLQMGSLDSSNAWFSRAVAINKTSDLGTRAQRLLDQHSIAQ